jgi:aspartate-semialdehyde dehydrogenase
METKITSVGILGATGEVGKNFIRLLQDNPEFKITYVAASPSSQGKRYAERVPFYNGAEIGDLVLGNANEPSNAIGKCEVIFSAFEADKSLSKADQERNIREVEFGHARAGFPVVSNNSANRWTEDIPMIIPEVNPDHLGVIPYQQKHHGFSKGFVVVKPNCNIQAFMLPIDALRKAGYQVSQMIVTTLQAISGAPTTPFMDMYDNVRTRIAGEKEKSENEPLKIFGKMDNGIIVNEGRLVISAKCNRVPITDGHTADLYVEFLDKRPSLEEIKEIWANYSGLPQKLGLYSAPKPAIVYSSSPDGPEAKLDRMNGRGMAVTVGQLEKCSVMDVKFAGHAHNTIRGAAGGAILTAELLKAQGYFKGLSG